MEYKWERVKEDAEVGFQIDSRIWLSDWLRATSNWKPIWAITETNEEKCEYYQTRMSFRTATEKFKIATILLLQSGKSPSKFWLVDVITNDLIR